MVEGGASNSLQLAGEDDLSNYRPGQIRRRSLSHGSNQLIDVE
jgi:hypothetical protein